MDGKKRVTDFLYSYPYGMIDLLCKWHFDVFGLIPKGLAVDINSINIPS